MKLKSYFAKDVKAAMESARVELGEEALLVSSRPSPPEARHLGECEVVIALPPSEGEPASMPEPPSDLPFAPGSRDEALHLSAEMAAVRRQMERMASAVARSNVMLAAKDLPRPELAEAFSRLADADVDPALAYELVGRLRAKELTGDGADAALAAEIGSRIACDPRMTNRSQRPRVVMLVGPCGSGKTTTLVKLAVRYGLSTRRPTQLISMDTCRIAAADQLRAYAAILGIGFQVVETPRALTQVIEEHRHKDLVLIDTPGLALNDLGEAADLARLLESRRDIETHLVLTASMKSADLTRVVDRFEIFRPQKLLFTKLDETGTYGPILNEAARTGRPVSFLAQGQRIPEDLEPATKERIASLVLERGFERAAAATA